MRTVLQATQLTKRYGNKNAVEALDLEVPSGSVYGILGPNGSGKTSTLGMVLGVLLPHSGSYSWFEEGDGHRLRMRVGALLEQPSFYPGMNARQNLALAAHIKRVATPDIPGVLRLAGLEGTAKKKFSAFSTGMKQRLAIASAMLGDPEVLVLDEPTNGLDPEGIADVRRLISEFADTGKTVILASHLLDEVEKLCSHVAVLKAGQKIFDGPVGSLLEGNEGILIGAADRQALIGILEEYRGVNALQEEGEMVRVQLSGDYKLTDLTAFLINRGTEITHISRGTGRLEKEFIKLLGR